MAVSSCSAISRARLGPEITPMRACGAISSSTWLISLKPCASIPLVRLTSSLPANASASGARTLRNALEGTATKIIWHAARVPGRSVTGSTPSWMRTSFR
ncbi:hypothetical protein D9M68_971450 [compost metagenome]